MKNVIIIIICAISLLYGCGKTNPMSGTSWESRNAVGLWSYSYCNDGDFAEVLKFDDEQVHNIKTRDGHTYKDKGWYGYSYEKEQGTECVNIYTSDTDVCYIYGNELRRNHVDLFYKQ